ncbi:hypothetical protein [Paenibacillus sp. FSL R10-2736]|uniref:hypothetical protein n=1 Tax=Paenibacillus sp. FSL R10-2736 TaxID=2954692 RepID=UPI0030FA2F7A
MNEDGLKLLILGQHIGISQINNQNSTINQIFDYLEAWPDSPDFTGDTNKGDPYVEPSVSWLIALLLESDWIEMKVLFLDPELYGMKIKSKLYDGVNIDISYRKVDDNLGLYQIDYQLPPAIRRQLIGAYTVTFPNIGLELYTNGDFQLDLGFPWNLDFSRSFQIEGYIPPGIPVLGSGGMYLGRFKEAKSDLLPPGDTYGAVLTFGFGMQVGIGKSFELGALKAGFSLTVVGILEGILAPIKSFTTHPASSAIPADALMDDKYYYNVQGVVGIVGKLFGTVDFCVIKADVNVDLSLLCQTTIEVNKSIPIELSANIAVSASLQIGCRWFKCTLHFSYNASISESMTIETKGGNLLTIPYEAMKWGNLAPSNVPKKLTVYLVPVVTKGGGWEAAASFVVTLMIEAEKIAGSSSGTLSSLQILSELILLELIAALRVEGPLNEAELLRDSVTLAEINKLVCKLTETKEQFPIPPEQLYDIFNNHFDLQINLKSAADDDLLDNLAFFPMVPKLSLEVTGEIPIDFEEHNKRNETDIQKFKEQINRMRVSYEANLFEQGSPNLCSSSNFLEFDKSGSTIVWCDYFAGIAGSMAKISQEIFKDQGNPDNMLIADLLDKLQKKEVYKHLTGLLSRQFFHGLRFSTGPADHGMGLYQLTGQQVDLSAVPDEGFEFSLENKENLKWITLKEEH